MTGQLNAALTNAAPADVVTSADGTTAYVAGRDGKIRVYDIASRALVATWDVGVKLGGMDLSPDGTFLLVTERTFLSYTPSSEAWWFNKGVVAVYKVALDTGSVTTLPVDVTGMQGPFFDVAVLNNGTAVLTESFNGATGSGPLLWTLDIATGHYLNQQSPYLTDDPMLWRTADGSKALIAPPNSSAEPLYLFSAGTGVTASSTGPGSSGTTNALGTQAISQAAGLIAQSQYKTILVRDFNLAIETNLATLHPELAGFVITGMAFDAAGANLYVLDEASDTITQFSTADWSTVRTFAVGAEVTDSTEFFPDGDYGNQLLVTPDSQYFVVVTGTGVRIVANDSLDNVFTGSETRDVLDGGAGNDHVYGVGGNDTLAGGAGDDVLNGGAGDDLMIGNAGVDSFDGGSESGLLNAITGYGDRISFADSRATQGAIADLRTGIISNDGFGNAETMTGIESLGSGTAFADTFYGNDSRNLLAGATGDSLFGFGGDDLIELSGAGAVDGGTGTDRLTLFASGGFYLPDTNADGVAEIASAMVAGWTVDLAAGTLVDGYGNSGTVAGIEEVVGSALGDLITGNSADNFLDGAGGNDVLDLSAGGNDTVLGGNGNDYIYFGGAFTAADTVVGGAGTDTVALLGTYNLTLGATTLSGIETLSLLSGTAAGGSGHVTYSITTVDANVPAGGTLTVYAGGLLSDETLLFDGHAETDGKLSVFGGAANDIIAGGPGSDAFVGGGGDDQLYGLGGNDWLEGGLGADMLRGGLGSDLFVYKSAGESTTGSIDHIVDFEDMTDLINLSAIDADTNLAGDQAFSFIGQNAFSHTAGELRITGSGSNWFVEGDINGDGLADLVIQVDNFRGGALEARDFML